MKLPIITVLILATLLSGCARVRESRFNPFNWAGSSRQAETVLYTAPTDARGLVAEVTLAKLEPYPGGAILRATGLPPTLGYWQADLVALPMAEEGRLVYEFRIAPPPAPVAAGTPYSRQVTVAVAISTIKLSGVTSIVVQGAGNALSVRR